MRIKNKSIKIITILISVLSTIFFVFYVFDETSGFTEISSRGIFLLIFIASGINITSYFAYRLIIIGITRGFSVKSIISTGLFVVILSCIFPPYYEVSHFKGFSSEVQCGYGFILSPPGGASDRSSVRIDISRLSLQWIVISLLGTLFYTLFRRKDYPGNQDCEDPCNISQDIEKIFCVNRDCNVDILPDDVCSNQQINQLCPKCFFIELGLDPKKEGKEECKGCPVISVEGYKYEAKVINTDCSVDCNLTNKNKGIDIENSSISQNDCDRRTIEDKQRGDGIGSIAQFMLVIFGLILTSVIFSFFSNKEIAIKVFFKVLNFILAYYFVRGAIFIYKKIMRKGE